MWTRASVARGVVSPAASLRQRPAEKRRCCAAEGNRSLELVTPQPEQAELQRLIGPALVRHVRRGESAAAAAGSMSAGATQLLFAALAGLALVAGSLAEAGASGFSRAETAAACAPGELFKRDFAGLGCYPDSADPRYYEAVHQLEAERAAFRTWLYGGIAAGVAALALGGLAYAVIGGCSSSKSQRKDA